MFLTSVQGLVGTLVKGIKDVVHKQNEFDIRNESILKAFFGSFELSGLCSQQKDG